MHYRTGRAAFFALTMACAAQSAHAAETGDGAVVAPLVVTGAPPLSDARTAGGLGRSGGAAEIARSHAVDLSAFLERTFDGVYVNDIQNNPLQPDVSFRGYTASPLLGTPQGLSLYMDGVRLNQPFGEAVSWDLIPRAAISSVALAAGSNPLFGLNSLGGALSIRTKSGLTDPGTRLEGSLGSAGRRTADLEIGGRIGGGLYGYLAGSVFGDEGWREASPSDANQLFGKLTWSGGGRTRIDLTGAYAETDLFGNGLQDKQLLERDYAGVYTRPDETRNWSSLINLSVEHDLSDALAFSANLYRRDIRTRTLNGDVNDDALGESVYQPSAAERAALAAAGYRGFPVAGESAANTPFPAWRCIANALLNDEPNEKCDGALNRARTNQAENGGSAQLVLTGPVGAMANRLTLGGGYISSRADFGQTTQFGFLNPDRSVTPVDGPGAFADGTQDSENAFDARVDLVGRTRTASLFAADTLSLTPRLDLTIAGRWDRTSVHNRDRIDPTGGPGSLTGDHVFSTFNPAANLTWRASDTLVAHLALTQASRAPSAIELGCADPDNPCRLPNAMAGDPPLKRVRSRTLEAGLSGQPRRGLNWRLNLFRAGNHDDILFVADDTSGFGYFKNFGATRRQGVEAGLAAQFRRVRLDASYTFLDATFRTPETVGGEGASSNTAGPGFEGEIQIDRGDRIPLVPRHLFKAGLRWDPADRLGFDLSALAASGVYARGNENNAHEPDGLYYLGPGRTPGYVVFDLGAEYRLAEGFTLFAQVDNLLDHRFYTAAQLGPTAFDAEGRFVARPFAGPVVDGERPLRATTFYAPGAPRLIRVGFRYQLN